VRKLYKNRKQENDEHRTQIEFYREGMKMRWSQVWSIMPVIPPTQEVEMGGLWFHRQRPRQKIKMRPFLKNKLCMEAHT
jgi:hypothetical protein